MANYTPVGASGGGGGALDNLMETVEAAEAMYIIKRSLFMRLTYQEHALQQT